MVYSLEYFHAKVLTTIEAWPADILADYARMVELVMEHGPDLGLPHSRALGSGLFELRPKGRSGIEHKMSKLKHEPVAHDHKRFLEKAAKRRGFSEAYEAMGTEYVLAHTLLEARRRAGLTQEAVANRMGTTKSAVSRLEGGTKHAPSVASLKRYAEAVGCTLSISLVPR
jgi:DNA-binding XRE family transcriptional regulator